MAMIPGNDSDYELIRVHLERKAPGFELQDVKVNTSSDARAVFMFMATSTTDTLQLQTSYNADYDLVDFRLTSKDA